MIGWSKVLPMVMATASLASVGALAFSIDEEQTFKKRKNDLMHTIYEAHSKASSTGGRRRTQQGDDMDSLLHLTWSDDNVHLLVEVTSAFEDAEANLRPHLERLGFRTTACSPYSCSGSLDISALQQVEELPSVLAIYPCVRILQSFGSGSVVSQALLALQIDNVLAAYPSLTGTGLKIGVLADSFNTLSGAAADVTTGDLPSNVVVLKELSFPGGIDAGRAMLQLIHDLAPDAELYFRTAYEGAADFAQGIQELADEGCHVIVDDTVYLFEPFFQNGVIAQSANDVAEVREIPYFSAAGNLARNSWEGVFVGSGQNNLDECEIHDFGNGQLSQQITVSAGGDATFILQWDEPYASVSGPPGSKSDMDFAMYAPGSTTIIAFSGDYNVGKDPVALISVPSGTYDLVLTLCEGPPPDLIKWVAFGSISNIDPPATASTIVHHRNTPFTAGVGAAFDQQVIGELELQSYSSAGGTPLLFDRDGSRKEEALVLEQPRFVGPDGSLNTFFGSDYPDGFRFFGTSAAAPNVAAVALLMLQANPDLTPSEVYKVLEDTATDMNERGFDFDSGHGFVNAKSAIDKVKKTAKKSKKKTKKGKKKRPKKKATTEIRFDQEGTQR